MAIDLKWTFCIHYSSLDVKRMLKAAFSLSVLKSAKWACGLWKTRRTSGFSPDFRRRSHSKTPTQWRDALTPVRQQCRCFSGLIFSGDVLTMMLDVRGYVLDGLLERNGDFSWHIGSRAKWLTRRTQPLPLVCDDGAFSLAWHIYRRYIFVFGIFYTVWLMLEHGWNGISKLIWLAHGYDATIMFSGFPFTRNAVFINTRLIRLDKHSILWFW